MSAQLKEIRQGMIEQFDRRGTVNIEEWVERYPEWRDEIMDYAYGLEALSGDLDYDRCGSSWDDVGGAVHRAVEAIEQGENPKTIVEEEEELEAALRKARRQLARQRGKGTAAVTFRRAAVYAWAFDILRQDQDMVSRYRVGKAVYLLEEALDLELFTSHKKMAAGPYDSDLRYRDAEPIADDRNWFSANGSMLVAETNLSEASKYGPRYVGNPEVAKALLTFLAQLTDAQFETWTTVLASARDLQEVDSPITLPAIKETIAGHEKWAGKLEKDRFSDSAILEALTHLNRLGLLD